ncbi:MULTISPECIES: hypothetical protein [Streptomyces]|uniref:Uncharacterized protein n=1 Tax=Streptomyces celluloflavus TaxID=58344 RepID=A0ABW7R6X5_9ACTN|nr:MULTISPECIES: hypothetical protein [Streptomyces]MYU56007.1 hypothetical protein [Streptomyces sp. SID7805]WSK16675.1 hypothetical protein OG717_36055 [Streptomyces celluloflavus]
MSGEISDISVAAAKAKAGRLLLAFRHGNQQAFDEALPEEMSAEESRDLVSALAWVANEAVRKAYRSDVADRVLHHLARKTPGEPGWVETDEAAAPGVVTLLEGLRDGDVEAVRALVRTTPDTTFVLGRLLTAVAMLLPSVPAGDLRRVLDELRAQCPPEPYGPGPAHAGSAGHLP